MLDTGHTNVYAYMIELHRNTNLENSGLRSRVNTAKADGMKLAKIMNKNALNTAEALQAPALCPGHGTLR